MPKCRKEIRESVEKPGHSVFDKGTRSLPWDFRFNVHEALLVAKILTSESSFSFCCLKNIGVLGAMRETHLSYQSGNQMGG